MCITLKDNPNLETCGGMPKTIKVFLEDILAQVDKVPKTWWTLEVKQLTQLRITTPNQTNVVFDSVDKDIQMTVVSKSRDQRNYNFA